jgi:hypothetical protein
VAVLLGATVARAETPAPATDPLDAARRDLRALPATGRSQEVLGKSSGFGSASLPALTIPNSSDVPQSKPEPNAPASATWLQDALKQTEVDRNQRRPLGDPSRERDEANHGYKPAKAANPLDQYLAQWLAPRDLEMFQPEARKAVDQKSKSPLELAATTQPLEMQGAPTGQTDFMTAPVLPLTKNPYLPEPELQPVGGTPVVLNSTAMHASDERSRVQATLSPVSSPPSLRETTPSSLKPATSLPEVVPVSPTAPLVDDRKYFPQLRRF